MKLILAENNNNNIAIAQGRADLQSPTHAINFVVILSDELKGMFNVQHILQLRSWTNGNNGERKRTKPGRSEENEETKT